MNTRVGRKQLALGNYRKWYCGFRVPSGENRGVEFVHELKVKTRQCVKDKNLVRDRLNVCCAVVEP